MRHPDLLGAGSTVLMDMLCLLLATLLVLGLPAQLFPLDTGKPADTAQARAELDTLEQRLAIAEQEQLRHRQAVEETSQRVQTGLAMLENVRREAKELDQRLTDVSAYRRQEEQQVETLKAAVEAARARRQVTARPLARQSTKKVVLFAAAGNRIAPITDEFFQAWRVRTEVVASQIKAGEPAEELRRESSAFSRMLVRSNPTTHFVGVIVSSDSFAVFRVARALAVERGFEVGWKPHSGEQGKLVFGPRGRAITPQ